MERGSAPELSSVLVSRHLWSAGCVPGVSPSSFHFISTLSDEADAVTAPIVQARRWRPRAACNLPKVVQPGGGGAGLYFLVYVLFGVVINNQEEKNLPG